MQDIRKFTRFIEPLVLKTGPSRTASSAVSLYHDQLLTSIDAARLLGISGRLLARWRAQQRSPGYWKASGKYGAVAYPLSVIVEWQRAVEPQAQQFGSRYHDFRSADRCSLFEAQSAR